MKRALALLLLSIGVVIIPAGAAQAHPLGNFTINQYSGMRVASQGIEIDHVIDLAEIPAFRELRDLGADRAEDLSTAAAAAYATRACRTAVEAIDVSSDGGPLPLDVVASSVSLPPGAGGLPTMRLECSYFIQRSAADLGTVTFTNTAFEDRIGWREITVVGDGTTITGDALRTTSVSARLTSYPDDLLSTALDERTVTFAVTPGGAALATPESDGPSAGDSTRGIDALSRSFTNLIAQQRLTFGMSIVAVFAAIALGALHAFAPGHGKTVMAAYLIGQRGSLRQAATIGLTVTATHTMGVLILGIILSASSALAPERMYSWLGVASGGLLLLIGAGLLRRALRNNGNSAVGHTHGPDTHHHGAHGTTHLRQRSAIAIGFAGGLVPSPSALVVLLGAIALGRAWFGVLLVVCYGAGMALSLIGAGLLLIRARRVVDTRWSPRIERLGRVLPIVSAVAILVVGSLLTTNAATRLDA